LPVENLLQNPENPYYVDAVEKYFRRPYGQEFNNIKYEEYHQLYEIRNPNGSSPNRATRDLDGRIIVKRKKPILTRTRFTKLNDGETYYYYKLLQTGSWRSEEELLGPFTYYRDRYFLKSYWDSTGMQMVRDGFGKEIHRYSNGVIASEGEYADGYQEGYWYGRHADGTMYFEENYNRGRLINGRSRSKSGRIAVYDGTTLFALPEGGYRKFNDHIHSKIEPQGLGTVKLSFRVTVDGQITDFKIEQSVSKELDMRAKQMVLMGPRWLPARLHGLEPTDGFGFVAIEF
jgi:hypothetical protein